LGEALSSMIQKRKEEIRGKKKEEEEGRERNKESSQFYWGP